MNATLRNIQANPAGSFRGFLFLALVVVVIVVLWKVLKGFTQITGALGDIAPKSEAEKGEILGSATYQSGVKWLDQTTGISAIVKAGYKKPSDYVAHKGFSYDALGNTAQQIWDAKFPFYISATEVYNAIASLPSKAAISLMSGVWDQYFRGRVGYYDLKTFLGKYLTVAEMQTLTQLIDKKPDL